MKHLVFYFVLSVKCVVNRFLAVFIITYKRMPDTCKMSSYLMASSCKKMNLYLFNPDHDMALGNNSAYYQAPASALKMANDLSWLPAWVVPDADSFVALPSTGRLEEWVQTLPVCPRAEWGCLTDGWGRCREIHPWGWNRALVHRLKEQGVADALLPGDMFLAVPSFPLAGRGTSFRIGRCAGEVWSLPGLSFVGRNQ